MVEHQLKIPCKLTTAEPLDLSFFSKTNRLMKENEWDEALCGCANAGVAKVI